jgi:anaerobic nitric oxide reductase transcription regulator
VDDFQRAVILKALNSNDGNWAATARTLGVNRSNLHHRASRLGLLR